MKVFGLGVKVATEEEMAAIRKTGERIVTGERGYRLVGYLDRATNRVFVSHELRTEETK